MVNIPSMHFNSQPHEEADHDAGHWREHRCISTHSLTKRLTVATVYGVVLSYFNSQPHEEADKIIRTDSQRKSISTHSLTKRLTKTVQWYINTINISTHSLTKRLTSSRRHLYHRNLYFNSQPHEEADGNFRQKYIYLKLFFTLIAHINLVFYSNHYIVNFFLVKYTHFLVRMSWSISVSLPFAL